MSSLPFLISLIIILGLCLIFSKNPGYTIILFMVIILCLVCLLFKYSVEFFAFILFYLYIGGILVLFLFFIMMVGDFYPKNYNKTIIVQHPAI
jgi:NADH:ubiquinone oxidoreductase subunit 6 (subunit J)